MVKANAASNSGLVPHEAARQTGRLLRWISGAVGPRRESATAAAVRNRVRDQVRNNPIASAALDVLETHVIGDGINVKPMLADPAITEQLVTDWEEWTEYCDFDQVTDWYGLQGRCYRAWKADGEAFVRLVPTEDPIPLRLQLLEADHVPHESRRLNNGHRVVDGAEIDAAGRLVAWWVLPGHPGDGELTSLDAQRVPASELLHIFKPSRPGQLRAVSSFAATLVRLKVIDDWDDAQLERQRVANLFLGFIRRPAADPLLQSLENTDGAPPQELPPLEFEPATLQELAPGEDVQFSDPPGTSDGYKDFSRAQLRRVAAALGIPYPLLTGDYDDVNDRVLRFPWNAFKRKAHQEINHVLVPQFCRPVRAAWVNAMVMARRLDKPASAGRCRWTPAAWPYAHPVQDVQATALEIKTGLKSRSEAQLERGYDAEHMDKEIAADKAREEDLGLAFDYAQAESTTGAQTDEASK